MCIRDSTGKDHGRVAEGNVAARSPSHHPIESHRPALLLSIANKVRHPPTTWGYLNFRWLGVYWLSFHWLRVYSLSRIGVHWLSFHWLCIYSLRLGLVDSGLRT